MTKRDLGKIGIGAVPKVSAVGEPARADYIEYMADLVHEIRVMAERSDCPTLAGILQLAHSEALREARLR